MLNRVPNCGGLRVLLVGNYEYDLQESMQRFAKLLANELPKYGVEVEVLKPSPFAGRLKPSPTGAGKWLGYIDKFVLFPLTLRRKIHAHAAEKNGAPFLVHICDHSNAFYTSLIEGIPHLVTCHDLLAVRGALGEDTDCPASPTGRFLQKMILSGLKRARYVACDSAATKSDLLRLAGRETDSKSSVVLLSTNYAFKSANHSDATNALRRYPLLDLSRPYLLHVGHNMRRKNREGILRIFARLKGKWDGQVVFAGEPLDESGLALARELGVRDCVVQVAKPTGVELEVLYNKAFALLYPSRAEGFGWPIIEAQACGCPVVCSDRTSVPEVAGNGGIVCALDDYDAYADAILRLQDETYRDTLIQAGYENLKRFSLDRMMTDYIEIYRQLTGQPVTSPQEQEESSASKVKEAALS